MRTVGYCLVRSEDHILPGHPEGPHRLGSIDPNNSRWVDPPIVALVPAQPDHELLQSVHDRAYLDILAGLDSDQMVVLDGGDTYANRHSFASARRAVGSGVAALEAVLSGTVESGFSLARPPGHHASSSQALGFCLLNSVAIMARHAQRLGCKRVLIIDFDVHHGNGTQDIFENDPDICYVSSHQEGIFPGTGQIDQTGVGPGKGSVVNIPLPAGATDDSLARLTRQILIPVTERFQPDIFLVSAGFDGHWRDPLAQLNFSLSGYTKFTQAILAMADEHCGGKCVFVLEGGYDPLVVKAAVDQVIAVLSATPLPSDPFENPEFVNPEIDRLLKQIRAEHNLY